MLRVLLYEEITSGHKLYFLYSDHLPYGYILDVPWPKEFKDPHKLDQYAIKRDETEVLKYILQNAQGIDNYVPTDTLRSIFNNRVQNTISEANSSITALAQTLGFDFSGERKIESYKGKTANDNYHQFIKNIRNIGYYSAAIGIVTDEEVPPPVESASYRNDRESEEAPPYQSELPQFHATTFVERDGIRRRLKIGQAGNERQTTFQENVSNETLRLKEVSKKCFINIINDLNLVKESENTVSCLNIVSSWLPPLYAEKSRFDSLSDYISFLLSNSRLSHLVLYSEPGSGKTYSFFDTYRKLIDSTVKYHGKTVVPLYFSSMLLSIYAKTIQQCVAEEVLRCDHAQVRNALKDVNGVHFVLLVDAINEGRSSSLIDELIQFSIGTTNVTLIVSSNNTDEVSTLKNSGFTEIRLNPLNAETVHDELKNYAPTEALKKLLCKPFYLKNYLENSGGEGYTDEYSVIDAYVQNCKKNVVISRTGSDVDGRKLFDQDFPAFCYSCAIVNQMFVSLDEAHEPASAFCDSVKTTNRLEQIGIIKRLDNAIYFVHEIYRDFFAAKYLYDKMQDLLDHIDAPDALKLTQIEKIIDLLQKAPVSVYSILAPKLHNCGILSEILKSFGALINDRTGIVNTMFYREIVNLFSFATNTLDGLVFHGANLWMTDFTKFDRIINCDFSNANLNPETLWLHHARIRYTKNNSGRICNDLIFLSGPEGFEVYNWKNDKQLFIEFPEPIIPDAWSLTVSGLIVQIGGSRYFVSTQEIENTLHDNTIINGDHLHLSESYVVSENNYCSDTPIRQILKNNRGDELIITPEKELFVKAQGKTTLTFLSGICNYATFFDADSDFIFADCDGVYIKKSTKGALSWMRIIKPIHPSIFMRSCDCLVIKMEMPGGKAVKYFMYDLYQKKMNYVDSNDVAKMINSGFFHSNADLDENLDSDSVFYNFKDNTHRIYGGAIEFTNSVFKDATIVNRKIDERERMILIDYGGIL